MTEQEKRESVIKEFKDNYRPYSPGYAHALVRNWAVRDAIDLLKAQEPRVMTLEEIPDAVFGWMEMFGQIIPCVLEDVYADDTVGFANIEDGHDYMCASDYGKTWRVWTSRPSDEQREATPWE